VMFLGIGDGDFDFYTSLDRERSDLLDDLSGALQINDAFVDAHLESVPGFGTFTTRSLAGSDPQGLGGHANWALDAEVLFLRCSDKFRAHCRKLS